MKLDDSRELVDQYSEMAMKNFDGKKTYQLIKFCMFEMKHCLDGHPEYLTEEEVAKKYLHWQNNINPKDKHIRHFYAFEHADDISWNDCISVSKKLREDRKKKKDSRKSMSAKEQFGKDVELDPMAEAFVKLEKLNESV